MEKAISPEKVVTPLKTEVITIVKERCPITSGISEDFKLEHCLDCPYLVKEGLYQEKVISHGWYEVVITEVRERSETEKDDPITDYYRTIPCAGCGSDVQFYSSYSVFVKGDKKECSNCGLLHTFLRFDKSKEGSPPVFAIPIKNWEEKQKPQKR